ncbi:hypothetical protein ACHAXT_002231 [Thalassiosira profunda]
MSTQQSLSFLDKEEVVAHFNDLLVLDPDETVAADIAIDNIDVHEIRNDASTLSLTDVLGELERRGRKGKGFYSDDCRLLQRCFDDEHEEYVRQKTEEAKEAKIADAESRRERYELHVQEQAIQEEKEAVLDDPRRSQWFELILARSGPLDCRIAVNNVSARALAKVLYSDDRLKSIDVSNMGLCDKAGAYIATSLSNNNTLASLEMDGNHFGPETCSTLAASLIVNKSLQSLSLASNPLSKGLGDEDASACVDLLARAIANNSGLICLSLWRCGIDLDGGKAICKAVSSNTNLISVEVGYNNFDNESIQLMHKQLGANRKAREARLARDAKLAEERERVLQEEQRAERERRKAEETQKWLEEQQAKRAEARRIEMEEKQREAGKEEEKRLQMERVQKAEEERVASKKKGKGKGKKKKKK